MVSKPHLPTGHTGHLSPCPCFRDTEAQWDQHLASGSPKSTEAKSQTWASRSTPAFSPSSPRGRAPRTGRRVKAELASPVLPHMGSFHLWRGASQRPHESQATPLYPKPLGRRLLQPFTHTNKNKSRCRPLNSAKASFPLAPRAARSCARGLGTLPADLALSLPAHPVSFSHRAARRAEWDVTAGTGVAAGCQEPAGYGPPGPRGQMPHTRVLPSPPSPPCPPPEG